MRRLLVGLAALSALVIALLSGQQAAAEKRGGILKLASPANPASMSPMEEATIDAEMPMMGVFNNLILFDQHIPQVSLETIRPDLATMDMERGRDRAALQIAQRCELTMADREAEAAERPGSVGHGGTLGGVLAGVLLLPGHAAPLNATEPPDGTAGANSFRPLTGRMRVGTVVRDHRGALFGPLRRYALSCPSCLVSIFISSASMCRQRRWCKAKLISTSPPPAPAQ